MNKNILDEEDELKNATDAFLFQEAQFPSGYPQFLVISEIQRRKKMRDRYSAQEQQPQQTVSDQIIAEAAPQMPPQGIGALQPQMPPQMPTEMMAGGGIVPPNSLVEDASKFDPQNLYDMDASQMAMANPTNMGIASVLPMAAGGVVSMNKGGFFDRVLGRTPESRQQRTDQLQDSMESIGLGNMQNPYSEESLEQAKVQGQLTKDFLYDPDDFKGNSATMAAALLLASPGKRIASNITKTALSKLGQWVQRNPQIFKNVTTRGPTGQFLSNAKVGIEGIKSGLGSLSPYIDPRNPKFWTRSVPTAGLGYKFLSDDSGSNDDQNISISGTSKNPVSDFLGSRGVPGYSSEVKKSDGGIVKMQNIGVVPDNSVSSDDITAFQNYVRDNPGVEIPPHLQQYVNLNNINASASSSDMFSSLNQQADETLLPSSMIDFAESLRKEENKFTGESNPIDVTEAMETGESLGDLNLTDYEMSEKIKELDTTTQESRIQEQIDALEEMKGKTPDTFDLTDSVLRSGERADKQAMSQALINLGAGIASGDISKGLSDAGSAVSGVRQRQEEFQQLAEMRKAEAESKASSDRMTRDIGITTAQIASYGDLQEQKNASGRLIIEREKMYYDAVQTGNANLIAQARNNLEIAQFSQQIIQFNSTLEAGIGEQSSLNERARISREIAAIREFGPNALLEGRRLSEPQKSAWIPKNLPDKSPGWSPSRALKDVLVGLGYVSSDTNISSSVSPVVRDTITLAP
tara:strand:- start:3941 stop:6184 length:2244 start_codon:yes stop_codon:yes gene_type:complete